MIKLDLIIVNWNSSGHLMNCLRSISLSNPTDSGVSLHSVIVVDNASTDNSLADIEKIGLPLIITKNEKNMGFAAACNQGARNSRADYLLFLNPDTMLYADSIYKPVAFLESPDNRSIGIVGIQLLDDTGTVSQTCTRFPRPATFFIKMFALDRLFPNRFPGHFMKEWDHLDSRDVDQVIGAFFLVRRFVFETLGGFDERFFVYFEEVDFSFRARKAGWRSHYYAEVQAYHKGGGSSEQIKAARLFYSLRSRILYSFKHFGWFAACCVMISTLFIEPTLRIAYAILKLSVRNISETIRGILMLWRDLPYWSRKIKTAQSNRKR